MSKPSFSEVVEVFSSAECQRLEAFLSSTTGLDEPERECVRRAAFDVLRSEAHLALIRVLVLELQAARLTGALIDIDPEVQFQAFLHRALESAFIAHLRDRYPVLDARLKRVLANRRMAIETMVSRILADRNRLASYFEVSCDRLTGLQLGLGDAHNGGHTVAKLDFSGSSFMYKPRPMQLDVSLDAFLENLFSAQVRRIRVPKVMDCGDYGWAEFVDHRYCEDEAELADFYRNLGRWIAVTRLLGGTDIHYENLIAAGPVPVVVDPECLFAHCGESVDTGRGAAHDEATRVIACSVLRTSIVPYRLPHAAFKGVDISSMGASAGQQSEVMAPILVDDGTIDARIDERKITLDMPRSMPSPKPYFTQYVEEVVDGFLEVTHRLRDLDDDGELHTLLEVFEGCIARKMFRPTQVYAELRHLLWHPASLHDASKARAKAMDMLNRVADERSLPPGHVAGELGDLEVRDIPVFRLQVTAEHIESALRFWRVDDLDMQEMILRGSLLAARLNDRDEDERGRHGSRAQGKADASIDEDRDALRRGLVQGAVQRLLKFSIRAPDGSVTWLGTALGANGWVVEPVQSDLYGGLGGITFALASYWHEMVRGRVEPVDGLRETVTGCVAAIRAMGSSPGPSANGGFNGAGAQIWLWLLLHSVLGEPELLEFAIECAGSVLAKGFDEDGECDLLAGEAGLIVPLIHLGSVTRDVRWLDLAGVVGRRLEDVAIVDDRGARWQSGVFEEPIGGYAHGATGIGWALARLSISQAGSLQERRHWNVIADQAFRFEMSLYDDSHGAWRDLRVREHSAFSNAWCHGGIGIGLAAADLYARTQREAYRQTMRIAVTSALKHGWHKGVSLCHGSLGLRELVFRSTELDDQLDPHVLDRGDLVIMSEMKHFLGGAERMARELFVPGLMNGLSGIVFGLCRMHPDCELPSPLLMEMGVDRSSVGAQPEMARRTRVNEAARFFR